MTQPTAAVLPLLKPPAIVISIDPALKVYAIVNSDSGRTLATCNNLEAAAKELARLTALFASVKI
jgi:hypothetical protein